MGPFPEFADSFQSNIVFGSVCTLVKAGRLFFMTVNLLQVRLFFNSHSQFRSLAPNLISGVLLLSGYSNDSRLFGSRYSDGLTVK
jgi:hypothetical protein